MAGAGFVVARHAGLAHWLCWSMSPRRCRELEAVYLRRWTSLIEAVFGVECGLLEVKVVGDPAVLIHHFGGLGSRCLGA